MKYDSPTVPIRIALRAVIQEDWERAENALIEALSAVRQQQAKAPKEAPKA